MSKRQREIVCRGCHEEFPLSDGQCPYCGTTIRNNRPLFVALAIGLTVTGASLINVSEMLFYAVIGLAMTAGAGYLLYEKRQRIDEATEDEEDLFGTSEETT